MMSQGINRNAPTSALRCVLVGLCLLVACVAPDKYCPPITLGDGSPIYPQRTEGGNVTMYRVFNTEGNLLQLNFTWVRVPSNLSNSNGRYYINKTLTNSSVIASITLWNLMIDPDVGSYTITACSNCTCNQTTFYLELFHCNPEALPQPVVKYTERTVMAKPSSSGVLYLYALFNGSTNTFLYTSNWVHNGKDLCIGGTDNDATVYSCNRTMLGNCMFTANLYIYGYSSKDSGNYTVQIIGSTSASRNATIHVDIINLPEIKNCTSGPLKTDRRGRAEFMCQVSYYVSKYDDVIVIENDHKQYNSSTENVTFGCSTNARDSSLATCTVNISTSLHSGSLKYKLCVVYNASASSMQCSKDITINVTENNSDTWSPLMLGLVIGGGTLLISVVLLLLLVGTVLKCRVHRKRKSLPDHDPSETRPLLTPGNSPHSNQATRIFPGSSPISSVTEQEESRIWQTVPPNVLEEDELVHIAQVVGDQWPVLAQHLGLTKRAITAIKHNYASDYKQQSFQMLIKWFNQQQEVFRTRQFIVRVIEEKMKDPVLAQSIIS